MTELRQVYKCDVCGNMVEVVHASIGQLVCCNQPMTLQVENTVDASREKHVPVVEKAGDQVTVKVGSAAHPMEEKHYIEWIEVTTDDGKTYRQYLEAGDKPEAVFNISAGDITARAYCNLHGLWKWE
ncbi:desulfoferrodoxin [Desulfallas thermosapovorans]|uniref:Desulfoferrodoxin n=1 Tax=Desulfallas thermosapovorans DSM 6562 TaxID=1121431 RepID=A0A5S4ZRT8_9FIRM|nr:desulfoferrodoxin [Desulfallas thermosapovorans]TYO94732.1 superoxide reductase [Desulfallas thermosapovorans DSM 6562]